MKLQGPVLYQEQVSVEEQSIPKTIPNGSAYTCTTPEEAVTPAIMASLKAGNSQVMITFFDLYYAPLCFFAYRLIRNRPAAEDIVEDSFMKLWKKHTDFESVQNIKAFLYITTRNACLNFLKQHQRDSASIRELAYLASEKEDHILNSMVRTEVLREIYQEIEKLPAQSRKVFKMSILENMKNQDIARQLDISIHTVKNQKMRAMQLLRTKLLTRKSLSLS